MGQYVLIMSLSLFVTASVVMSGIRSDVSDTDQTLNLRYTKLLARDAALTGFQMVTLKLAKDPDPWIDGSVYEVSGSDGSGSSYATVVATVGYPPGDTVQVQSIGTRHYIGLDGVPRDTTHVIDVRFVRYTDPGVPLAFRYAITTDTEIHLQGNMHIGSLDSLINAGIHTNGYLWTTGNSFLVEGYGTYTTSVHVPQDDNFVPNNDTNRTRPNVFWADSVKIPNLDLSELVNTSTLHVGGDLTIDGNTFPYTSFAQWAQGIGSSTGSGTEADPFILVVDGTLSFLNEVHLSGFGIVASLSKIIIDPLGSEGGLIGGLYGPCVQLGIYTPGFIDIRGNAQIIGSLYGKDYIQFHGTPNVTGGLVTHDARFSAGGNPEIIHSTIKLGNGWGLESRIVGPRVVAYAEW